MATPEAGSQSKENEVDKLPSQEEMSKMSHSDLYTLRDKYKSKEAQDIISPYEHRAFAREYVEESPVVGGLGMVGAIPLYQAYKATGSDSRSGVSGKQVVEGFRGLAEGVVAAVKKPWERAWNTLGQMGAEAPAAPKAATPPPTAKPWEMAWSGEPAAKAEKPKANPKKLNKTDRELAAQLTMTPEEMAADEAFNLTPGNVAELKAEIAKTKDPKNKEILLAELAKINEKLKGK